MPPALPDSLAVVSPHLDDAVLSLGAFLAALARSGRRVTVVTVFAGDPDSTKPAGGWDRRAGFATEGEAVSARRREDRAACGLVGAEPVWLGYSEVDYRETLEELDIRVRVLEAVRETRAVLVPGFPLTNPDHRLLSGLLAGHESGDHAVGLYAEQPYRDWARRERSKLEFESPVESALGRVRWTRIGANPLHLRAKRRAVREYRSQIPLLGLDRGRPSRLDRMLWHELLARGEAIAWRSDR